MVGVIVLFFFLTLPLAFRLDGSSASAEKHGAEDSDDPVVDLWCLKGLEAMSEGSYTRAIAHYTKAIERDPKYAFAYIGRGDAHRANGDLDRAVADYDQARRVDPGNETARERADETRKERAYR